jgi:hypothetical protein
MVTMTPDELRRSYGPECLQEWSQKLHSRGIRLIISHHNFKRTMKRSEILKVLQDGQFPDRATLRRMLWVALALFAYWGLISYP